MNKFISKCKTLLGFKKPTPWYKKCLKRTALIMDMKRRNKFITFFALLFIAVYFCLPSMESIVKKAVHKYGSEITGTDVSLGGFEIKLSNGEGHVKSVKIDNPKKYKSPTLFYLKDVGVKIDIASLTEDIIVIDSIDVDNPVITYEMLSLHENNISDVLDNVKSNTAKTPKKSTQKKSEKTTPKDEKKIVIKKLTIRNGQINVMTGFGKYKKSISLSLPDIVMHDIGENKKGASISETISTVISKILHTVSQTVISSNLKGISDASVQEIKDVSNNIKNSGKQAAENAKGMAKNLKNNMNNLFK